MRSTASTRFTASGWFIAVLLVAFSASGLLAGVMTRQIGGFSLGGSPSATAPTAQPSSTSPAAASAFDLHVQLAPNPAHAGQSVQLTVTAFTASSAPVANVRCTPVQTPGAPNFTPWPGSLATDASGQARWTLQVPDQTTPGSYQIYVQGDGASRHGKWYGTLVVAS